MTEQNSAKNNLDFNNTARHIAVFGYLWFSFLAIRVFLRYVIVKSSAELPSGLEWIGPQNSIIFWGILWGIAGVLGIIGSIQMLRSENYKIFIYSIIALVSLHFIWAGAYFVGWAFLNGGATAWLGSSTYTAPIGLLVGYAIYALKVNRGMFLNKKLEEK